MKKYEIREDLLVGVLQYLNIKPFNEVRQLIKGLEQVIPIEEEKKVQPIKNKGKE